MNSKTLIEIKNQRFKIDNNSIYGLWSDEAGLFEAKISPHGAHTRIKIMRINDPSVLERIAFFCGLKLMPKRSHWKGFDFVTGLERISDNVFKEGIIHMPNSNRKNIAQLKVCEQRQLLLEFYFYDYRQHRETLQFVGALKLFKNTPAHVALRQAG